MTFSDTEMMELGIKHPTKIHNAKPLIRTLKYALDILQTEEAFTVEEYRQTDRHTHTHTPLLFIYLVMIEINRKIVYFEHISHLALVFLLLTFSRQMPAGYVNESFHRISS